MLELKNDVELAEHREEKKLWEKQESQSIEKDERIEQMHRKNKTYHVTSN